MDAIVTAFASNAPYAAIFLVMINKLYGDWKEERLAASVERAAMQAQIYALQKSIDLLSAHIEEIIVAAYKAGRQAPEYDPGATKPIFGPNSP